MKIDLLENHLSHFKELIDLICCEDNHVLGGSLALKLHGLNFREAQDLDIVIYNPTEKQLQIFETLKPFERKNKDEFYTQRSYKYLKSGLAINFLLEFDTDMPLNLLTHSSGWRINSIKEIINAKKNYCRTKDLLDLLDLKNKNF